MFSGKVMKLLGVTHVTLREWERKGILVPRRNELNWRVYDVGQITYLKKRLIKGRRDGKKLLISSQNGHS